MRASSFLQFKLCAPPHVMALSLLLGLLIDLWFALVMASRCNVMNKTSMFFKTKYLHRFYLCSASDLFVDNFIDVEGVRTGLNLKDMERLKTAVYSSEEVSQVSDLVFYL